MQLKYVSNAQISQCCKKVNAHESENVNHYVMYKLNSTLYLIFLNLNSIFLYNLSSKNILCYHAVGRCGENFSVTEDLRMSSFVWYTACFMLHLKYIISLPPCNEASGQINSQLLDRGENWASKLLHDSPRSHTSVESDFQWRTFLSPRLSTQCFTHQFPPVGFFVSPSKENQAIFRSNVPLS